MRPPPSPWVETIISVFAFVAPEWGLFASACVSAGGLCLAEGPACAFVSASKISVSRTSGDRFGDWVVSASARASDREFWPRVFASNNFAPGSWALVFGQSAAVGSLIMLNDRENILSALREKPLKVYEIMKRANIPNEEACQSLLLKMRDDGLVKFDIHKERWLIG